MAVYETPTEIQAILQIPFDIKNNLVQLGRDLADHQRLRTWNKTVVNNMLSALVQVEKTISEFKKSLRLFQHLDIVHVSVCDQRLKRCGVHLNILRKDLRDIDKEINGSRSSVYPSTFLRELNGLQLRFQSLQEDLSIVEASLQDMDQIRLAKNKLTISDRDEVFKVVDPLIVVPKNPPRVMLDYSVQSSYESQLKHAIFRTDITDAIGAVAKGIGGVGKTVILNDIGRQKNTHERFPGGVLYTSLGSDATLQTLVYSLARFVEMSGGKATPKLIRQQKEDLDEAVRLSAEWFKNNICLFVIDDIWCLNGIQRSVATTLSRLAAHPFSRVVFSTRDSNVECSAQETIRICKREKPESRKILLHCSTLQQEPKDIEARQAFETLLNRCDGLPIALSIVGSLVQSIRMRYSEEDSAWEIALSELDNKPTIHRTAQNNKFSVKELLFASIRAIDATNSNTCCTDSTDICITESVSERRFKAFAVLQKRQSVPFDVLSRLWGTSAEETIAQVESFERFSLIEINYYYKGEMRKSVTIHDLVLDVARDIGMNISAETCKRFIGSYNTEVLSSCPPETHSQGCCVSFPFSRKFKNIFPPKPKPSTPRYASFAQVWTTLDDDGFALTNLFRFLEMAGMQDKCLQLLKLPQWIRKQFETNGRSQLEQDIQVVLNSFDNLASLTVKKRYELDQYLNILRSALVQGEHYFSDHLDRSMIFTHLYGRMLYFTEENAIIENFTESIRETKESWMKPSIGAMPIPNPSIRRVLEISKVLNISHARNEAKIIAIDTNTILVHEFSNEENQLKIKFSMSVHMKERERVKDVALSSDGNAIAYVTNKRICWCQIVRNQDVIIENSEDLHVHEDSISTVFISRDGQRVVVAGLNSGIIVFDKIGRNWNSSMLGDDLTGLLDICTSDNAHRIVSVYDPNVVYLWDLNIIHWGKVKLQHNFNDVRCVDMAVDGKSFVLGGFEGNIWIWKLRNGHWSSIELKCHEKLVIRVKFSSDGQRFASYSIDNTFRLWDCNSEKWNCSKELKLSLARFPHCLLSRPNNGKIWVVSGGTLSVLDLNYCDTKKVSFDGHESKVHKIDLSTCGKRMISRSDKTVIVWDFSKGDWKRIWLKRYDDCDDGVTDVSVSGDAHKFVIGYCDGKIEVFDIKNSRWNSEYIGKGQDRYISTRVVMDFDGSSIISYADEERKVQVWKKLKIHGSWTNAFDLNVDQEVISLLLFSSGCRFLLGFKDHVEDWKFENGNWSHNKYIPDFNARETVLMRTDGGRLRVGSISEGSSNPNVWRHKLSKYKDKLDPYKGWVTGFEPNEIHSLNFQRFDKNEKQYGEGGPKNVTEECLDTFLAYKSHVVLLKNKPYLSFFVKQG